MRGRHPRPARPSPPASRSARHVTSPIITRQRDLDELCKRIESADLIGFDTEFVSEDTFHPELCLIQVVTPTELAVVDPQALDVRAFWQILARGDHTTVLHAGREELSFILRAVKTRRR
ncbi:MAG: hypothetical protein DCC67_08800 [Planctomycetota bacterium]|nr:MAG: hypothetical protein DCC67_08800 [Planctomycetota bacterium]